MDGVNGVECAKGKLVAEDLRIAWVFDIFVHDGIDVAAAALDKESQAVVAERLFDGGGDGRW